MMIGEWQEAEPEIGQVAMVYSISRGNFLGICRLNRSGDKVWYDENSGREYDLDKVDEWAPITTPEEQRLRLEVDRLREGIRKHRAGINTCTITDRKLWALIETEAGGAGDGCK